MSILGTIDSIKGRGNIHATIDLIKRDEPYDKKRNVLSAKEIFELCYKRYVLLKQILQPLKEKLSQYLDIIDIGYQNDLNGEISIIVKYRYNGKEFMYAVNRLDPTLIDVVLESHEDVIDLSMNNKQGFLNAFNDIIDNSLDSENTLTSTSRNFAIQSDPNTFGVNNNDPKVLSITGDYASYEKSGLMYDRNKVIANYKKVKSLLQEDENVLNVYNHLKVYEDSLEKILIKK